MRSLRIGLAVWVVLMGFLMLTVFASFFLSGPLSLIVSMSIALAKAFLVYWFYMHLREEGGLIRMAAFVVVVWLLVFLALGASDYMTRNYWN